MSNGTHTDGGEPLLIWLLIRRASFELAGVRCRARAERGSGRKCNPARRASAPCAGERVIPLAIRAVRAVRAVRAARAAKPRGRPAVGQLCLAPGGSGRWPEQTQGQLPVRRAEIVGAGPSAGQADAYRVE